MRLSWASVVGTVGGLVASGFLACSRFSSADDPSADAGDGSAPSEAGPADPADATDGPSADAQEASVRFCSVAPPHAFCDDFDDGPLGNAWSRRTGSDAGLMLDTTSSSSPPTSMQVDVDPLSSTFTFRTALEYDFPGNTTPQGLTIAFALRVTALGSPNTLNPVRVRFDGSQSAVAFTLFGTSVQVVDEDTDSGVRTSRSTALNVVLGAWNTIELSIPKSAQPTLKVNNLSAPVSLTARIALPLHLEVGAPFAAGPSSQWTLEIDNVTLDTVP